jgi:hypothetical protein
LIRDENEGVIKDENEDEAMGGQGDNDGGTKSKEPL